LFKDTFLLFVYYDIFRGKIAIRFSKKGIILIMMQEDMRDLLLLANVVLIAKICYITFKDW